MKRKSVQKTASLSVSLYQEQVLARYRSLLDEDAYAQLCAAVKRPLYPALRINPLKVDPAAAIHDWSERYRWKVQQVPYCSTGWQVTSSEKPISRALEHRLGYFYIQDAASMLPIELFDFPANQDEPLILDLAASPGGKTTHLVSRAGDRGLVMANDSSQSRITALRLVLNTWGAVSAAVTHFPGEFFGAWFPDTFDAVLLDAPCSMESLRSTETHPMRPITPHERQGLAQRQARLLEAALQAVKPGGQVVYSTCTLSPEEDEGVLDALLKQYPGAIEIESLENRLPAPVPGLTGDENSVFSPQVSRAARLWPHCFDTSGFFAALIRKTGSIPAPVQAPPYRAFENTGFEALSKGEIDRLAGQWLDDFQFDLHGLLDRRKLVLYRRQSTIYALPEMYIRRFESLPCQSAGLEVGEMLPDGVLPAHDWVTRFFAEFKSGRVTLPADAVSAWLRGSDIQGSDFSERVISRFAIIVDEENRLLGRGKVLADRVKNLLPRKLLVDSS